MPFHQAREDPEWWGIGIHLAQCSWERVACRLERVVDNHPGPVVGNHQERVVDNHQAAAGIALGDIDPADIALAGIGLADIAPAGTDLGDIAPVVRTDFAQFGAGFAYRPAYRNRSQSRACKARRR